MKKYFVLFMALGACVAISCNKEIKTPAGGMKTVTITATVDDGDAKTSYVDGATFSWSAGDQISILCSNGEFYPFTAQSTAAVTSFTGSIPDGVSLGDYAFFPADAYHAYSGLKFSIPEYKDLTSHTSADMPMVGDKGEGNSYSFMHCSGAAKITVGNIPSKFVSLKITMTHPSLKLSGLFGVFKSGEFWRYNPDTGSNDSEKTFSRKVAVVDGNASIYIPYASAADWWGRNTVSVIGYDSSDVATTLIESKTMSKSLGAIARAHVLPLAPLVLNGLEYIEWTDPGVSNFTVSYGGTSMRILDWKGTSDSYYVYFRFRINKEKIAYDSTNMTYDSSNASYIYMAFDTNDMTGTNASGGVQGSGWDAQAFVRPFTGTTQGSVEFKDGEDASSYIQNPIGTSTSKKVTTNGYIDGANAYVSIAIPRSAIGAPSSGASIKVQSAMNYYYTDTGTLVLK